jgi:hypothetical protein
MKIKISQKFCFDLLIMSVIPNIAMLNCKNN